ncbi:MAG: hypothetical protein ACTS5A_04115 [Candidatus Hodgkinia cicadicola]
MILSFGSITKSTSDNPNLSHLCGRSLAESANSWSHPLGFTAATTQSLLVFRRPLRVTKARRTCGSHCGRHN